MFDSGFKYSGSANPTGVSNEHAWQFKTCEVKVIQYEMGLAIKSIEDVNPLLTKMKVNFEESETRLIVFNSWLNSLKTDDLEIIPLNRDRHSNLSVFSTSMISNAGTS